MRATRRYWAVAALAGVLAGLALLLARPLLLAGAVGLAAFLVAAQVAFHRALRRAVDALAVEQRPGRDRVTAGAPVTVTLAASTAGPAPLRLDVEAGLPVAATGAARERRTATVPRHGRSAGTTFPVTLPVAGAVEFRRPTVAATDPLGLLVETLRAGEPATVTVEPRGPRDVHLGAGGERVAAAFGEHGAGRLGRGLDPTELREYVPGDAANRIDWKATARLGAPFVREDEAETDRPTVLVVDHRAAMGVGPPGETKLDYVRQVALAVANAAREHDDPLGCLAVGDGGITVERLPASTPEGYAAVRRDLLGLSPTERTGPTGGPRVHGPATAGARARDLDDGSAFAATLRPFLDDAAAYVRRVDEEPLFRTARSRLGRVRGTAWTVLLTDDTDRAQVKEAVKVARRGGGHVAAVLAPHVLFEPGGLADVAAAYDRYRDFEAFRRGLAGMDRVSAFEVAPGDRVEAVLDAGRRRRAAGRRS